MNRAALVQMGGHAAGTDPWPEKSFAAYVALCERTLVAQRIDALFREPETSWRDREMEDLQAFLVEVDRMVVHHRDAAKFRGQ